MAKVLFLLSDLDSWSIAFNQAKASSFITSLSSIALNGTDNILREVDFFILK